MRVRVGRGGVSKNVGNVSKANDVLVGRDSEAGQTIEGAAVTEAL